MVMDTTNRCVSVFTFVIVDHNIATIVDVKALAEYVKTLPGVTISREYKYIAPIRDRNLFRKILRNIHLTESLWRRARRCCMSTPSVPRGKGGLNPYYFQMVNIRENVSWVHTDRIAATEKAIDLARAAVQRVFHHKALETKHVKIHPDVLVVGGGIAGIMHRSHLQTLARKCIS